MGYPGMRFADEDEAYDYYRQKALDEESEMSLKDAADAMKSVPFREGREAGKAGHSIEMNPHKDGTVEYEEWRLGWRSGIKLFAYRAAG